MPPEPKRGKTGRPKAVAPVRMTVVALKGTADWKQWLDGFAHDRRLGLADTIEQALLFYAQECKYVPPPKR